MQFLHSFAGQISLPDDFEQKAWEKLLDMVHAVHQRKPVSHSRQELFQAVEDMCMHKMAAGLHTKLEAVCNEHINSIVGGLRDVAGSRNVFLGAVRDLWATHCEQMVLIRQVFVYLDRTYMPSNSEHRSLWGMGMHLLAKAYSAESVVRSRTTRSLLDYVAAARSGEIVDKSLASAIVAMLEVLGCYHEDVEPTLLREASTFYQSEGQSKLASLPLATYLHAAEQRLSEESESGGSVLPPTTCRQLVSIVEAKLLSAHVEAMLSGADFTQLLAQREKEHLARMYRLFTRLSDESASALKSAFVAFVKGTATSIVGDTDNEKEIIANLLSLKDDMDTIVAEAFAGAPAFVYGLKSAFESAVNSRGQRCAELLAKFVDTKMKAGNKVETEEQIEQILDRVMVLFRVLAPKDVFEAYYKKDLAKRLLLDKSASTDMERGFLQRLKTECGSAFTAKLEGMFRDMETSSTLIESFRESEEGAVDAAAGITSDVRVLTASHWPQSAPIPELILSPELQACTDAFSRFYEKKFSGSRGLAWQHALSYVVLRAKFPSGRKELSVSLYQALVLLQYNDAEVQQRGIGDGASADGISVQHLASRTGLPADELKRTVMSMVMGKVRVLVKEPKTKEFKDSDIVSFNGAFKSKMMRLKINQLQLKETKKEVAETNQRIEKERQYQIDAALVRIMKTRQTLKHTQLMAEALQALRFPAKPTDIKKRIESLIERDYIDREEDDPTTLMYLA